MGYRLILAFAIFAGASALRSERIAGGNLTTIQNYPSLVQVESRNLYAEVWTHTCGASILTSRYLLSAAHCFSGLFYSVRLRRVRAGTTYRGSNGLIRYAEREFNHPTFGEQGNDGDITVVMLELPLIYSPEIQQATIISAGAVIPDDLPVIQAGWGHINEGGPYSPLLLDATVYTVNNTACAELYQTLDKPAVVTDNMVCTGLLGEGGRGACQGDFGGPLYYDSVIIGVSSWGHGCGNETFPSVNTAVSPYTNWIIAIVG